MMMEDVSITDAEWEREQVERAVEFIECVPYSAMDNPATAFECWARFRRLAKAWRAEHPAEE